MMIQHRFVCLCTLTLFTLLAGCAGVQPPPPPPPPAIDTGPYLATARAAAERGDIQKALAYLRLAQAIRPDDQTIADARTRLETEVKQKAAQHFNRGEANFKRKRLKAAQRDFMATLRYDPTHAQAMDYLKNKLSPPSATAYRVVKGDSLKGIAKKVYNDPEKAFLIAYFNDLKGGDTPPPGTTLQLPLLKGMALVEAPKTAEKKKTDKPAPAADSEEGVLAGYGQDDKYRFDGLQLNEMTLSIYEDKASEIEKDLVKVRLMMGKRDYDGAIELSRQILEKDPGNEEAAEVVNAAYYQMGAALSKKKKYSDSLEMFEEVDLEYRDVETRIGQVKTEMKSQADRFYRQGVNYYVNENLPGAIDSWEKTLALDPDHQKAPQDIEKARQLLKKLQAIQ